MWGGGDVNVDEEEKENLYSRQNGGWCDVFFFALVWLVFFGPKKEKKEILGGSV